MAKIDSETGLKNVIQALEKRQAIEGQLLKAEFHDAFESLRPINLLKSTFAQAAFSLPLRGKVVDVSIGLVVGYLSKLLYKGNSNTPMTNVVGATLQYGITNIVAKNPGIFKWLGTMVFRLLKRKSIEKVTPDNDSL